MGRLEAVGGAAAELWKGSVITAVSVDPAGVIWVGHNYASVVNRPRWRPLAASDLSDPDSPKLKEVINREHGTFRWASVVTWCAGIFMLWHRGWLPGAVQLQGTLAPIGVGVYIGTLMMLNVRFVLWPHQKKVLQARRECAARWFCRTAPAQE